MIEQFLKHISNHFIFSLASVIEKCRWQTYATITIITKKMQTTFFDELALMNRFTNVNKNIVDIYAKKAKYESSDQKPETSNSIVLCSRRFAEKANRSLKKQIGKMLKNPSWSSIKELIHCPLHHLQLV